MGLGRLVSIKLTLCLIVGIIVGFYLEIPISLPFLALLFLLVWMAFVFRKKSRVSIYIFVALVAAAFVCLGILTIRMAHPGSQPQTYLKHHLASSHAFGVKITDVLKPTDFSHRYFVEIATVDEQAANGKILLNISRNPSQKQFGVDDELVVYGKLDSVNPPLNPYQFDYRDYLKKQGIHHQISADSAQVLPLNHKKTTLFGRAQDLRKHIITKLEQHTFGTEELSVIQALLLGERSAVSQETYDDYKNAGAVHILAISGLHVGILLLLLQFLLKPMERLPKGRTLKLVTIVLLLWSFAFVAGLSPSIVRAVTMFSFVAYALHLNRPTNTFNTLVWSMFFILLFEPLFLFQVGFQMSYAAVFAIVWLYPKLQDFWRPKNVLLRKTWQLFSVGVAAQLGVLPLSLFYFHQFPALFFVSNLAVVPFLGFTLGCGILVIVLALLDMLPAFLVSAYNGIIHMMNAVIGFVAEQEAFVFKQIPFDAVQMVTAYLIIIFLVLVLSKPRFRHIAFLGISILLLQGWVLYDSVQAKSKQALVVAHQTKNNILLNRSGDAVQVHTHAVEAAKRTVSDYVVGEKIDSVAYFPLRNMYKIGHKTFYVMDSLGLKPPIQPDYLLITHSPRMNFERFLDGMEPKKIIADGSNYKSYVSRWKKTCQKRKIPFHYTGERGAFIIDLNALD
ncbi:MAG: competence protein [Muricauda sp.]|nr:ComEC/Rec2 family competence protein [Allomuricauda sp.]MAU27530.1 competence protein [Allomuricauda sp.]MBC30649.1 competence protein [Allomuricauda sp.]|tara:strand:- start:37852 stop:39876 length:2025 start_codon:yes stop_codon:yes gene_type:complete